MKPTKLTDEDVQAHLSMLSSWDFAEGAISKTFEFSGFVKSMQFVNILAEAAEDIQHHPDLDIRFSKVKVVLTTHDAGGVTETDFQLANLADEYSESIG
jgi:4a-hydroxytetrahydrobiopterin dehydratase